MDTKLTRSDLDAALDSLTARAAVIAKSSPPGDQAEELSGEAELLEQQVATADVQYFHDRVEDIIRNAGMVKPESDNE